jgi:hypothetical protein
MLTYADVPDGRWRCRIWALGPSSSAPVIRDRLMLRLQPAYVSIRQHTSAYASIRQFCAGDTRPSDVAAAACIRQHTSAYVSIRQFCAVDTRPFDVAAAACIRQHTSAYVSIRQHKSAYVSIRQLKRQNTLVLTTRPEL